MRLFLSKMKTLEWYNGTLRLVDQARLPGELCFVDCETYQEVARAIKDLQVRGAPAIGVAAAYGVALASLGSSESKREKLLQELDEAIAVLGATRPTAVNLFWALERMRRVAQGQLGTVDEIRATLLAEAHSMAREDEECNLAIGRFGASFIHDGANILTHCNAGALATVAYGTALGVVRAAHEQGKKVHVYADETRPVLQGARLTTWELMRDGIPVTLISDNMAGYLMSLGRVDLVIVGADRIAANGDVANKIGTYSVAVLARAHNIPFYVAAPTSTVDLSIPNGQAITIEERSAGEVTTIAGQAIAPSGVAVFNPAFDVTPNAYVSAIITENGVAQAPYEKSLYSKSRGDFSIDI
jgi:methylthioribose-1-phosphate isomerase